MYVYQITTGGLPWKESGVAFHPYKQPWPRCKGDYIHKIFMEHSLFFSYAVDILCYETPNIFRLLIDILPVRAMHCAEHRCIH